ncbi:C40 family peptidase [Lacticaseibacillus parakribbianus]|uniref:C40 family peptidase n=1 Tax=Lacticaseibacillus parakribbianus TaxID=2970927 RepID=UPI0021CB5825|nr:C40 family peptidase [Lacticaseibacillus parakribbianus]
MKLTKSLTMIAVATLIAAGTFSTGATVSADTVSDAKSALSAKKSEGDKLLADLQTAQENVAKIDNKVSDKTLAIEKAKAAVAATTKTIAGYDTQIAKQSKEVASRKAVLKKQLISLQKQVGDSATGNIYLDFLLNAKDLSDLVSRGMTVNKLNQANKDALDAVKEAKAKVTTLKADQVAKKTELVATENQLVADKTDLTKLQAQAKKESAALDKKLADNKDAVAKLQAKLTSATAQAATLAAAAAKAKTTAKAAATTIQKATTTGNTATKTTTPKPAGNVSGSYGSGSYSSMVSAAVSMVGRPYVYAAASPSVGFDCSGLVMWAASQVGISLPHQAAQQGNYGSEVSLSSLQPGDLLFWGSRGAAYHVAIYVGGGQYVHAPRPGESVRVVSLAGTFTPSFARRL